MFVAGASLAWNSKDFDQAKIIPVLGRDIFGSSTIASAAIDLGLVHKKLGIRIANETPLGTVIAAPKPEDRELFCRNGLKWFSKIEPAKIKATLKEIERQRAALLRARPASPSQKNLLRELDLAARMAAQSCKFMLWQQAVAAGKISKAGPMALAGIRELKQLQKNFERYWPLRNKATPKHCSGFLQWRIDDYRAKLSRSHGSF